MQKLIKIESKFYKNEYLKYLIAFVIDNLKFIYESDILRIEFSNFSK